MCTISSLSIHLLMALRLLPFYGYVNNSTMKTGLHIPFELVFLFSSGKYSGVKLMDHMVLLFLIFLRKFHTIFLFCLFFFFLVFLGLHLQHMEVPRLGVQSELQLLAYATATFDPSHVRDLHHSSWQCRILNWLSKTRNQTRILMDANHWATTGTPLSFWWQTLTGVRWYLIVLSI